MTQIYEWLRIIKNYFFPEQVNKKRAIIAFFIAFVFAMLCVYIYRPPTDFPVGQVITIDSGESLQSITNILYSKHVIRFPVIFRSTVIILGGEKRVIAGDYLLDEREGPVDLAYRLVKGQFHLEPIKVTIPEGWNAFQITNYLEKNILNFDKAQFLTLAKNNEGYLFPDTYFISKTAKPNNLIEIMKKNFEQKINSVSGIATSTHNLKEIIIVASILEGEALPKDRSVVAGILWKRLEIGMPLQVDSTFSYINGKNTYELTLDDLKIDSPYNTYKYKGLPPGPISNPGLEAIISAIIPTKTKYLYFLTEKDGTIHYAKTFEEHKRNKELYLR
ncbi:MAG: endolytic transglycosylase MltG [Candidatus Paceibacterota bacterium]|jgi:UPF0755 protein